MKVTKLHNSKQTFKEYIEFLTIWNSNVPFVAQNTSGSTGKPKSIKIEKEKMTASANMTGNFLKLKEMNNALLCISPKYIGGKMMVVRAIYCGLDLIIAPTSANPLKDLNEKVDFAAMVPLQVETILQQTPEKFELIDTVIIGGAPVSNHLAKLLSRKKTKFYATFGMTETVSHIALREIHTQSKLYKAIGNTTFSLSEESRLIIHAPDLQISRLETNDLVSLHSPRTFEWIGRADFIINSGGVKVNPEKLEELFSPYIEQAFIVAGMPDLRLGQKVVLIAEKPIDITVLKQDTKNQIDSYSFPKEVIISTIMYTPNGKPDRLATLKNINLEG